MSLEIYGDDSAFLRAPKPLVVEPLRTFRILDLFSGCGGLTLGVEAAALHLGCAIDVRLAAESDPLVAQVYADNFSLPEQRIVASIEQCFDQRPGRKLSPVENASLSKIGKDTVDLLVGGPPCQGHSTLNNYTRGDDPKNRLYLSIVRAAEILQPTAVIIENVPAIERDKHGVLTQARKRLEKCGYKTDSAVISVADIGVPQRRHRHILFAAIDRQPDILLALRSARIEAPRDLHWAIGDLCHERSSPLDEAAVLSKDNLRRATHLLKKNIYDLPNRLRPPCHRGEHKYKSMYGRLKWNEPAQTITSGFGSPGQGRYLHPEQLRTLTPHEAARIQFFPDWFDFSKLTFRRHLAQTIGNAVPAKLAFVLANDVFSRLQDIVPPPAQPTSLDFSLKRTSKTAQSARGTTTNHMSFP